MELTLFSILVVSGPAAKEVMKVELPGKVLHAPHRGVGEEQAPLALGHALGQGLEIHQEQAQEQEQEIKNRSWRRNKTKKFVVTRGKAKVAACMSKRTRSMNKSLRKRLPP